MLAFIIFGLAIYGVFNYEEVKTVHIEDLDYIRDLKILGRKW